MAAANEVLLSELISRKIIFDAGRSEIKEGEKFLYEKLFSRLKILSLGTGIYYRARKIDRVKDVIEDKKIKLAGDGSILGFDEENSGVPPTEKCIAGRLNKEGEQVLYIADDILTSFGEIKAKSNEYISLAGYKTQRKIKVLDFTPFCRADYENFFDKDLVFEFHEKGYDLQHLFTRIQVVLMMREYRKDNYKVPNAVADIIKEVSKSMDVDGIQYISDYTKGNNIALWNFSDMKFIGKNGEVYNFYKNESAYDIYMSLNTGNIISRGNITEDIRKRMDADKDKIRNRLVYDLFNGSRSKL